MMSGQLFVTFKWKNAIYRIKKVITAKCAVDTLINEMMKWTCGIYCPERSVLITSIAVI